MKETWRENKWMKQIQKQSYENNKAINHSMWLCS